jgi:EAL domain-containing protein (putative c-di-GMP-specific phosphodiesterase class I)
MAYERLRIVLVEEPETAWALEEAARQALPGAVCVQADNEGALQAAILDATPDVVVYGLHCPIFDGVTALQLTRRLAPDALFLVVAGPADRERAAACLWEGADDYIVRRELARLEQVVIAARIRKRALGADGDGAGGPPVRRDPNLRQELLQGLAQRQLRVHYHATVSFATGRIVGFEALLRWKHPRRGLLLPHHFVPAAEETGLIEPIGRWVIREACRFAKVLAPDGTGPAVSVNLSPVQFRREDLADQVASVLAETGVDGRRLRFEITEGAILDDVSAAARKLERLKAMGAAVDIDDFGTGYASLNCLRSLPIDAVKIDRSLVDRMGSEPAERAMVRSVVQLTARLGLASVAEGVRRQEDIVQLQRMGCQYGQGFFFSPPVHAPEARGLLTRHWPSTPPLPARVEPTPRAHEGDRGFLGDPHQLPSLIRLVDRMGPGPHASGRRVLS